MKTRFKKAFFNKKRDFFIAYALILLLPIVFNFISFWYTESVLEEKVKDAYLLTIQSSQNYIDNTLIGIVRANLSLAENQELSELSKKPDLSNTNEKSSLLKINNIWQIHDMYTSSISQRIIFFPKSNTAYTKNNLISPNNLYNYFYSGNSLDTSDAKIESDFSFAEFRDKLLFNKKTGFINFKTSSGMRLFYSQPVSEYISENINFNIIIELNLEHLLVQSRTRSGADFFIGLPDGTILSNSLTAAEEKAAAELTARGSNFGIIKKDGKKLVVIQTVSQTNDWSYGMVMSLKEYRKSIPMTRELTFICIMIGIILGVMLIWWLTDRTYTPLKNISKILNQQDNDQHYSDLYTNIRNSVENILNKNTTLADRFDASASTLKTTVMTNILFGKTNDKLAYADQLAMLDIKMDENMFSVIIVGAENNASTIFSADENAEISEEEKRSLSKLIISNIIHEMLSENYICEPLITDAFVVFIVNYSTEGAAFRNDVISILSQAADIIKKEFSFQILSAVSNAKISLDTVSSAYREAVLCFEHIAHSNLSLLFYEDLLSQNSGFILNFPKFNSDIKEALSKKNYKKCRDIIKTTIYSIQQSQTLTPEMAQIFACDLLRLIMNSGLISASDKAKSLLISAEYDRIMSEKSTVSNILLRTMNIIDSYLRDYIEIDAERSNEKLYETVKEYIDTHYGDPELSAAQLSEHFNVSSAYLSTRFKKIYGIGVLDYIRSVRIEQAKLLLKTTEMSNEDISAYVGYINTRTFLRAFQKLENMTPKEFRKADDKPKTENEKLSE